MPTAKSFFIGYSVIMQGVCQKEKSRKNFYKNQDKKPEPLDFRRKKHDTLVKDKAECYN